MFHGLRALTSLLVLALILVAAYETRAWIPYGFIRSQLPLNPWGDPDLEGPVCFNDSVADLAEDDEYMFAVGRFNRASRCLGKAALLNAATGQLATSYELQPHVNDGYITKVIADGSGGWILAGTFTKVRGQNRNRLARINADGSLSTWNPSPNGDVYALHVVGTTLYVGGSFSSILSTTRNNAAAINLATGALTAWNPNVGGSVSTILSSAGKLYLIGDFSSVAATTRPLGGVARYDLISGAWEAFDLGFSGNVSYYHAGWAEDGSRLYFSGSYPAGSLHRNIAAYSTPTPGNWTVATGGFTSRPIANDIVNQVIPDGSGGYILGGRFTTINGTTRSRLAAITSAGTLDSLNLAMSGAAGTCTISTSVTHLARNGTRLFVGGCFTSFGGQARNALAAVELSTRTVNTTWNPAPNGNILAMALAGGKLYVGGTFTTISGQPRNRIAVYDATTLALESTTYEIDNGAVNALKVVSGTLYAGGTFTASSAQARTRIAAFDAPTGTLLAWAPTVNNTIRAIEADSNYIYLGGDFTSVNSNTRTRFAVFNLTGDLQPWAPSFNSSVSTILSDETMLYVGGSFTTVNSSEMRGLAAFTIATTALDTVDRPNPGGSVSGLNFVGANLYVVGSFLNLSSTPADIRSIDPSTMEVTTVYKVPTGTSNSGEIRRLLIDGSILYFAGGFLNVAPGVSRDYLAAVNLSNGTITSFNPDLYHLGFHQGSYDGIEEIIMVGDKIHVVGRMKHDLRFEGEVYFATIHKVTGVVETSAMPYLDRRAVSIAEQGGQILLGGFFSMGGMEVRTLRGFAVFEKASMKLMTESRGVGANLAGWLGPTHLSVHGDFLYVGGNWGFTNFFGRSGTLVRINRKTGSPTSFNPQVSFPSSADTYTAVVADDTGLYLSGPFTSAGGSSRSRFAQFAIDTMTLTSWAPNPNNTVQGITVADGKIYLGGSFTSIAGQARSYAAAFDVATKNIDPWAPSYNGDIYSVNTNSTHVWFTGEFTSVDGNTRQGASRHLRSDGSLDLTLGVVPNAWTVAISSTHAFFGGTEESTNHPGLSRWLLSTRAVNNVPNLRIDDLRYYSNSFSSLSVSKLLISGNYLWVAGTFDVSLRTTGGMSLGVWDLSTSNWVH